MAYRCAAVPNTLKEYLKTKGKMEKKALAEEKIRLKEVYGKKKREKKEEKWKKV